MTNFFTNQENNTLFNKFAGVFEHNKSIRHFDILVGYFRSSGYFKIRPYLDNVEKIRILVGIDADSMIARQYEQGLQFLRVSKEEARDAWKKAANKDIDEAKYDQETEDGIRQFIDDIVNGKLIIKAHPSQKIHAKVYIFRPNNFNEHNIGSVITGSSNLSSAGLGVSNQPNYEFNALLNNYSDVLFATEEFEKLWSEAIDILPENARAVIDDSHLREVTPFELYIKLFGQI